VLSGAKRVMITSGPLDADHAHHVGEDRVVSPDLQRLLGILGEAEVERAVKNCSASVDRRAASSSWVRITPSRSPTSGRSGSARHRRA
jgi:hypothetical protein